MQLQNTSNLKNNNSEIPLGEFSRFGVWKPILSTESLKDSISQADLSHTTTSKSDFFIYLKSKKYPIPMEKCSTNCFQPSSNQTPFSSLNTFTFQVEPLDSRNVTKSPTDAPNFRANFTGSLYKAIKKISINVSE